MNATMNPPTVYVVDDDPSVRDAMQVFLGVNDLPAATFASAAEFLARYDPDWNGCLLLDLRMPEVGGLELQRLLAGRGCLLPIVILTAHGDVKTVRTALKAGAFDFLEKPADNDVLLDVVRSAMAHDASQRRSAAAQQKHRERLARLTLRERQVAELLAQGANHREIAQALGISPRTVEVYKARLMEKLQARTLADVVRFMAESDKVV